MSSLGSLVKFTGKWQGVNKLWLPPAEMPYESSSVATLSVVIKEKFVRIDYTWAFEGEPQEGFLLFGYEAEAAVVTAVWVDSWHLGDKVMLCRGMTGADGSLDVHGSYTVPDQPDWGWRMVIRPGDGDAWRIVMYNVSPEGEEFLGVEASYSRG
jgi:hypothetical protein